MRETLLEGLLYSDLIGFHTYQYKENFLKTVRNTFPIEYDAKSIFIDKRIVKADVFSISIDFERYNSATDDENTKQKVSELREITKGMKVVLSIDRLDYSKGITNRLLAIGRFLEKYTEFRKKVLFIVVIVPSRIGV
jgi:trehalose 6-phosphate synthase/phosphatase